MGGVLLRRIPWLGQIDGVGMNSFDEMRARPGDRARHVKQDRKLKQLCRQVQRSLSLAIGGELADPMLSDLWVEDVRPAPDAGRLCVRLRVPQRGAGVAEIHRRLEAVEGFFAPRSPAPSRESVRRN